MISPEVEKYWSTPYIPTNKRYKPPRNSTVKTIDTAPFKWPRGPKSILWSNSVKQRDNNKCTKCNNTHHLHAHHLKEWYKYPELRFDIDNGITLCSKCHKQVHKSVKILNKY